MLPLRHCVVSRTVATALNPSTTLTINNHNNNDKNNHSNRAQQQPRTRIVNTPPFHPTSGKNNALSIKPPPLLSFFAGAAATLLLGLAPIHVSRRFAFSFDTTLVARASVAGRHGLGGFVGVLPFQFLVSSFFVVEALELAGLCKEKREGELVSEPLDYGEFKVVLKI